MRYGMLIKCISLCFLPVSMAYADIVGRWQTIDDETGKPKSIVEIYQQDGKFYGKVLDLLLKPDNTLCEKCEGELKDKPVVGMQILSGMIKKEAEYVDGTILDPSKGTVYRCKMWLDGDDKLQVRGYITFLYRTQTWHRQK